MLHRADGQGAGPQLREVEDLGTRVKSLPFALRLPPNPCFSKLSFSNRRQIQTPPPPLVMGRGMET